MARKWFLLMGGHVRLHRSLASPVIGVVDREKGDHMGASPTVRRVVTGLDPDGRSTILIDGPAPNVIWSSPDTPARNDGGADAGHAAFGFPEAGVNFVWIEMKPGDAVDMHATDTLDFLVVLAGKITLITETGETVLGPGDALVDRGVAHAWRNDGDETCRIAGALVAARPLGTERGLSR